MIVAALPGQEGLGSWCEALEGGTAPKFFFIHTVTAFNFAVLLRAPGFDIAQPHPGLLHREGKGERAIDLQFLDGKRERGSKGAEEEVAGLLIFPGIEAEDPIAGTVINGGVLETLGAGDCDFFDIHLHTVSRALATEECQLPRTPLRLPAERRIPEPMADAANRGGGHADLVDTLEPNTGADCPVLKVAAGVLN